MYLEHFNLKEYAFSLTPNTDFFLNALSYREALNTLLVALKSGDGFIKITGEVGTGKTLLCRKLLNSLGEDYEVAYVANPALSDLDMYRVIAESLGIQETQFSHGHQLIQMLTNRLIQLHHEGKRVVLLIDEAQSMSDDTLEAVRLLSNIETETRKLIQIVLFGQPELDERLADPSMRHLRQRIIFSYCLQAMDKKSMRGYLQHRLMVAGYQGQELFHSNAIHALYKASRGIPRLINILGHKAMMVAYGKGTKCITKAHIEKAILDTEDVIRGRHTSYWKNHEFFLGLMIMVLFSLGVWVVPHWLS